MWRAYLLYIGPMLTFDTGTFDDFRHCSRASSEPIVHDTLTLTLSLTQSPTTLRINAQANTHVNKADLHRNARLLRLEVRHGAVVLGQKLDLLRVEGHVQRRAGDGRSSPWADIFTPIAGTISWN